MNYFERKTKAGEVIGFETYYKGIPELNPDIKTLFESRQGEDEERRKANEERLAPFMKDWEIVTDPCDKEGRIERLDYTTDVYEDGCVYNKYCNVYIQ